MSALRALARDWLPPAVVRWIRPTPRVARIRFEGDFATWEEASALSTGYEAEDILAKVLAATLKVKHGEAAFERDSVLFEDIQYAWPVLAGLLWVAARNGGELSVLDFGGALGSSYFQNRKFLQSLPNLRWSVVEQPHYVDAGQRYVQDEHLRFYRTIDACLAENQPNVVLLSGVLQCIPDPLGTLTALTAIGTDALVLDRTSFSVGGTKESIKLQHVPETIYKAIYPCRVFNEADLCRFISSLGYQLLEEYASLDDFDLNTYWKGHIFVRRHTGP